jgi:hypothetical protein
MTCYEREEELDKDQIVIREHIYLMDDTPRRSIITGTAQNLKLITGARIIQRCDVLGRGLTNKPVPYCPVKE